MEKEINNVCMNCGIAAKTLTCLRIYGNRPNKLCSDISTFYKGFCDCCGEERELTQARDFFYPDFTLLSKKNTMKIHDFLLDLKSE